MDNAGRMALHSVREVDNFSHIHKVCGHMSEPYIKWHREHSKNAKFSDGDHYARRAYMGRTDRLQQTDILYIDHFLQYCSTERVRSTTLLRLLFFVRFFSFAQRSCNRGGGYRRKICTVPTPFLCLPDPLKKMMDSNSGPCVC